MARTFYAGIYLLLLFIHACHVSGCFSVLVGGGSSRRTYEPTESVIESHTERPGEDKEVPPLTDTIKPKIVPGMTLMPPEVMVCCPDGVVVNEVLVGVGGPDDAQPGNVSNHSKLSWDGIFLSCEILENYYLKKSTYIEILDSQRIDSLLIYKDEGEVSRAGSVGCCSFIDQDENLDFLNDLGPEFETLAAICAGSMAEIDSSTAVPAHCVLCGEIKGH